MPRDLVATPSQTVGPFFGFGLTTDVSLGRMVRPETPGEPLVLRIRVVDGGGDPVPDAIVELWHADAAGRYPDVAAVAPGAPPGAYPSWGRLPTREDGTCEFSTIKPGSVTGADGRVQAAHVNVCLFMRGLLRHVFTRAYFDGDPQLGEDALFQAVPAERRGTLLARKVGDAPAWHFDIRMQGDAETVFLNV